MTIHPPRFNHRHRHLDTTGAQLDRRATGRLLQTDRSTPRVLSRIHAEVSWDIG